LKKNFFILCFFISASLVSAATVVSDSYHKIINQNINDSIKCRLLGELIWEKVLFSNTDSSKILAYKQLKLAQKTSNIYYIAEAFNTIGVCFYFENNFKKALLFYKVAANYRIALKNKNGEASCYNNIALCYEEISDFEKAILYINKAFAIRILLADRNALSSLYVNLGTLYQTLNDIEKAKENYIKAILFCKPNSNDLAVIYNNLGTVYSEKKEYFFAKYYLLKSYAIAQENSNKLLSFKVLNNLINNALSCKQKKDLELYISKSKEYLKNDEYSFSYFYRLYNFAQYFKLQNKFDKALEYNNLALNRIENLRDLKIASGIYFLQYELLREKNSKQALTFLYKYSNLKDSIQDQNYRLSLRLLEIKNKEKIDLSIQQKENELYKAEYNRNRYIFISIVLFLILIIFSTVYYLNLRSIENKLNMSRLEQSLLQQNMSPHFIFNSLAIIQSKYDDNNASDAKKYLQGFAFLLRSILTNSTQKNISISKEIELITSYLELIKMSYEFEIEYSIEIDNSLVETETFIPTMLIQPLVENAFIHGIKSEQKEGVIELKIYGKNKRLYVSIIDNGTGVSKEILENQKSLKNTSIGLAVTQKRVAHANNTSDITKYFEISNLTNSNNKILGCKISFSIPLITV
jgi:tetratricopeptide (TPR) repeat protein